MNKKLKSKLDKNSKNTKQDKNLNNVNQKLIVNQLFYKRNNYTSKKKAKPKVADIILAENKLKLKYNPINILFMILGSLYIYPHIYMNMRFVDSMVPVSEELKKALSSTIKLSKVILSDKFRDADILQKSILLKEKEYEINHE
jgi:hypothetical protein